MKRQLELINQIRKELDELELLLEVELDEAIDSSPPEYMKLELWVDGGSKGNPGLGYGSYVFYDVAEYKIEFGDNMTNNEAEYEALLAGFLRVSQEYDIKKVDLTIKTDSSLVMNQLQRNWAVKADNLRPLFEKATRWLKQFHSWNIDLVPHRDIELVLGH